MTPRIASLFFEGQKRKACAARLVQFDVMNTWIETSPAMTLSDPAAPRAILRVHSADSDLSRVALCVAKKQNPCYAFLFAGLRGRPEASESKMEKKEDGEEGCGRLDVLTGRRRQGRFFYSNRL